MNKLTFVLVAALSIATLGCKKGGAKGGDCDQAINHSMELAKADMSKTPSMDDKMLAKMRDVGVQRCKEDKWSDDVLKCMTDAKTETESQACYGKLPQALQDKMNKAAMEAMSPPAAAAGAGSADGSGSAAAAAGSADGSGSAGSATK